MSSIGVIIGREFRERVMKKSFILTTILTPLLIVGLYVGMFFMMTMKVDSKQIMVIDRSGAIASELESGGAITYHPTDRTIESLREDGEGAFDGILVIGENVMNDPSDVSIYSYSTLSMEVEGSIASDIEKVIERHRLASYDIDNLPQIIEDIKADVSMKSYKFGEGQDEDKQSSSIFASGLAYIFGIMMYLFVMMYGVMVMQGVIEEKGSKVLEVMVSTVKPYQLMMGKIIGIASVALLQFLIWILIIVVGGILTMRFLVPADVVASAAAASADTTAMTAQMSGADSEIAAILANVMDVGFLVKFFGCFLIYFIGGYLLYAALYAAMGSAVDSMEEAQQFQTPVTLPVLLGFVVMMYAMKEPNASLVVWCSMIPFTSPVVMMARLPFDVPTWQIIVSVVILYLSFAGMVWMAAKIYRIGIFMHGRKPSYKDLYKWLRMKN